MRDICSGSRAAKYELAEWRPRMPNWIRSAVKLKATAMPPRPDGPSVRAMTIVPPTLSEQDCDLRTEREEHVGCQRRVASARPWRCDGTSASGMVIDAGPSLATSRRDSPEARGYPATQMCGICGILAFSSGFDASEETVVRDARHDGPPRPRRRAAPRRGARATAASRSATGGSRSSTSRRRGTTRCRTRTERVWITFNGEIYNHRALRSELEAKGHRYRSHCRHRDDHPPLRGGGAPLRRAAAGDVRDRDLGRAPARAVPRARPARDQAALLRPAARAGSCSHRRSRRCWPTRRSRPSSTRRRSSTT